MELLSRFRKKKTSPAMEQDRPEVSLKKWQKLLTRVEYLKEDEYVLRDNLIDGTNSAAPTNTPTWLAGTVLKRTMTHEIPQDGSEELSMPTSVSVYHKEVRKNAQGALEETIVRDYYLDPKSQIILDYTDTDFPDGKQITDTTDKTFEKLDFLVWSLQTGEIPMKPTRTSS